MTKHWGMAFLLLVGCELQLQSRPVTESTAGEAVQMEDRAAGTEVMKTTDAEQVQEPVTADVDGAEQAKLDIAGGKLILREQPLPNPPWWGKYSRLLRDRCGIEIEVIKHATANFSDADLEYNAAMTSEIERQFGKGIVGKLRDEAVSGK